MTHIKQLMQVMVATTALAICATAAVADGAKIFVIGGKPDDPFWSKVKKGAEDAGLVAKATGGSVTWLGPATYDNLGPNAAKLIRTALNQHPSAIVGPDWVAEAEDAAFKEVAAAHVPLIIYNSGGMDAAKRLGAMNYVGSDEYVAGVGGGEYFSSHGYRKLSNGGGTEELLLHAGANAFPTSVSADGKWLAYSQTGNKTKDDIWLFPLAGEPKPVVYLDSPFDEIKAQFSPDGKWMAYASDETGQYQVYVQSIPADGSQAPGLYPARGASPLAPRRQGAFLRFGGV